MAQNKKWYGEELLTADATNTRVHSPFKFTKNVLLKAFRFRLIWVNDPTVTSISGKIYSDDGSTAPGSLIATSTDSRTKANITSVLTNNNAIVETYVLFNEVPLRKNTDYFFVLGLSGYTYSAGSFIAFEKGYPDPVILDKSRHLYLKLLTNPFYAFPIFSEL